MCSGTRGKGTVIQNNYLEVGHEGEERHKQNRDHDD